MDKAMQNLRKLKTIFEQRLPDAAFDDAGNFVQALFALAEELSADKRSMLEDFASEGDLDFRFFNEAEEEVEKGLEEFTSQMQATRGLLQKALADPGIPKPDSDDEIDDGSVEDIGTEDTDDDDDDDDRGVKVRQWSDSDIESDLANYLSS